METIPMNKIRNDIRDLAKKWADGCENYVWIGDLVKLGSDIQNYADKYALEQVEAFCDEKNPLHTKLLSRQRNIMLGLNDVLSEGIYTGEEVDVTADKIFLNFIQPLLRLIEVQKDSLRLTEVK